MNRAAWTEQHRVTYGVLKSGPELGDNGAFMLPMGREVLGVICSDQDGWDHVSVSTRYRTPSWKEMCFVKDAFFGHDEWVVQYHPAKDDYIDCHPYCLHLWKPHGQDVPKPLAWMVGPIATKENP